MGKKKYSTEEKLEIAEEVTNGKIGVNEAGRKIGCSAADIRKWVAAYERHGIAGLESQKKSYTGEFKQIVVEDMRNNGLSQREAAAKYNIGIHDTVGKWERVYLEEGPEGLYIERRGRARATSGIHKGEKPNLNKQVEEDLIAEVQRLRAEVAYLKKLNALVQKREQQERKPKRSGN